MNIVGMSVLIWQKKTTLILFNAINTGTYVKVTQRNLTIRLHTL
jgi:hypothetical protein